MSPDKIDKSIFYFYHNKIDFTWNALCFCVEDDEFLSLQGFGNKLEFHGNINLFFDNTQEY